MSNDKGLENLFPMHPTPDGNGFVPVVGSVILSALVNGLCVLVTFAPLVFLVKVVFL